MPENLTAVVFTGGDPVGAAAAHRLPDEAFVVAADSGLEHARALGVHVDLAVGDFDSVDPAALADAAAAGTRIERHPEAKDATDLELGLRAAVAAGATRVVVAGGHGGRVDHFLANALLLCAGEFAAVRVTAVLGDALLTVVHDEAELSGDPGDLVSLLPVGGPARGVHTDGLLYPLRGEDLPASTTRGVSNELARNRAHVRLGSGTVLAVQPGLPGTHLATGVMPVTDPTATPTTTEERP